MRIVLDSNILFSALIKDARTRKIILEYNDFFLFPSYIFIEMEKYKREIMKKSALNNEEFNKLLHLLLEKVMIIPDEVLLAYKKKAIEIVNDIDPNDVLFVAAALAYPNSIIWSNDKKIKKQVKVKVLNTQEILEVIYD
jgi:predicted nucleic acid-binding protein